MHPDVILYARAAFIKKHTDSLRVAYNRLSANIRLHATDINKKQEYAEQLKLNAANFFDLLEKVDPGPKGTTRLQEILDTLITKFSEHIKKTKEECTPERYLNAEHYNALVPQELQPDEKRILPSTINQKIVPSLFGLYEHLWDKDLRAYVRSKDKKSFDLLVKVPGEGKTSRMLAMATTMHTVLLTITRLATFNSTFFKDQSLQMMENRLYRYDHFGMIQHAHREVDQMILIRLLHLLACVVVADVSPMEYVQMQMNGANRLIEDMAAHVYTALENCSPMCIRSLIQEAVAQLNQKCTRVGFCIDELSAVAYVSDTL
jgi:hypothetical protein